jgi:hypothetical protein
MLGQQLEQAYPRENNGMGRPATVVPLQIREFGNWQEPLLISAVLLALFGLVLLSACANVAGLLLARVARRQREIAVRVALGARRSGLIRMLLAESFGLAALGAAAGAILFFWLTRVLHSISLPAGLGALNLSLDVDATVGLYALALVVGTGLLCGIVPRSERNRGARGAIPSKFIRKPVSHRWMAGPQWWSSPCLVFRQRQQSSRDITLPESNVTSGEAISSYRLKGYSEGGRHGEVAHEAGDISLRAAVDLRCQLRARDHRGQSARGLDVFAGSRDRPRARHFCCTTCSIIRSRRWPTRWAEPRRRAVSWRAARERVCATRGRLVRFQHGRDRDR